ncbi:GntR family transcriptional regulator [Desulfoluna sp.]|uniref:GntR family transcriptional regulator n=1 Tax=Desulfoluna sp. TaxID=2045199 RepID=UPI002631A81A|nr:GntR family transcriptional regulator [Desulfoluna sp.]
MNFSNHQAIYLQIADQICHAILTGTRKAQERLPSVRDLAVEIEVNPNTAARAYTHLQDRQIVFNKRGIGYFITEEAREIILCEKREHFRSTELPRLFRMMDLLDIGMDTLQKLYEDDPNTEDKA